MTITKQEIVELVQTNDAALFRAMHHFAGATCHPFVQGVSKAYVKNGKVTQNQINAVRKFLKNPKDNIHIDILHVAALKKDAERVRKEKEEKKAAQLLLDFDQPIEDAPTLTPEEDAAEEAAVKEEVEAEGCDAFNARWIEFKNEFARLEALAEKKAYELKLKDGW